MNTVNTPDASTVFELESLGLSNGDELILRGGRSKFGLLPKAFEGVKTIAVIGWGSQAPSHAQNGRDSLLEAESGIKVIVGLRPDSTKHAAVRAAGFSEEDGTLCTIETAVMRADMVVLLISDQAQVDHWEEIISLMKTGSTLCFAHGFLLGYLGLKGLKIRDDINIVMVAPKGMGPSLRALYEQARETEGAGINSSVAVEQDVNGHAIDYALGWSVAIGSPVTFFTTITNEWRSDLTGERFVLLPVPWALAEASFESLTKEGMDTADAFLDSVKGLTSTVTNGISEHGLLGFYQSLDQEEREYFEMGYVAIHEPARSLCEKIYESVVAGKEIAHVIDAGPRLKESPMESIEKQPMWQLGAGLYGERATMTADLAFNAGLYVGAMIAQMEVLVEHGHSISEVVNESLVEAVDSLTPYMDARGVAYMVDNCSITARLGTRKWAPAIKAMFAKAFVSPDLVNGSFNGFLGHPLHDDIRKLFMLRPATKIAVS